jgi:hypothetical protein
MLPALLNGAAVRITAPFASVMIFLIPAHLRILAATVNDDSALDGHTVITIWRDFG